MRKHKTQVAQEKKESKMITVGFWSVGFGENARAKEDDHVWEIRLPAG